jgi:hypothetical protein
MEKPSREPTSNLGDIQETAKAKNRPSVKARQLEGQQEIERDASANLLSMNVLNKNVEVYYNLHKKCLSVRKRGLVIDHVSSILLKNAEFVVQPAGRKRVVKEKRKNVHAYIRGERVAVASFDGKSERITYNPYKNKSFVSVETGKPVYKKAIVAITGKDILGQ